MGSVILLSAHILKRGAGMKLKQYDVPGLLFFRLRNEKKIGLIELVAAEIIFFAEEADMGESIKTVEGFIDWTNQGEGEPFVYRGMPNAEVGVESSASRRIRQSRKTLPPLPVPPRLHRAVVAGRKGAQVSGARRQRSYEFAVTCGLTTLRCSNLPD